MNSSDWSEWRCHCVPAESSLLVNKVICTAHRRRRWDDHEIKRETDAAGAEIDQCQRQLWHLAQIKTHTCSDLLQWRLMSREQRWRTSSVFTVTATSGAGFKERTREISEESSKRVDTTGLMGLNRKRRRFIQKRQLCGNVFYIGLFTLTTTSI